MKIWYNTPWQGAGFFALNAANLSEENEKLLRTMIQLQSMTCGHYHIPLTNMLQEVERPANVVLPYETLKMFESGEKKEGWEITLAICSCIKREVDILG